jgi:transcriptional regulator
MYTPPYSKNQNKQEIADFIRQNGFGVLINQLEGKPYATHIPMMLSEDGSKISGHLARGNKQWKNFDANPDVLAIFSGPHTYISSSWYDHENVPTWNYIAAHVTGQIKIIEGEELLESLKQLTDKYEKPSAKPFTVEGMSPGYLKKEMLGIVGFEISITNIEATYKLSQNRDKENYQRVITALEERKDNDSHEIAEEMKKRRP